MKNQKFLSLAFAIALLVTMVPTSFAASTDTITITGEVEGGVAITAGIDITLSIDTANGQPLDDTITNQSGEATAGNTLTVWNNNDNGFHVTAALTSGSSDTKANTLGIAAGTIDLDEEAGTIKFLSAEQAGTGETSLGGGTDVDAFAVYSGATSVYSNANTGGAVDGLCTAGTIEVDHQLAGDSTTLPGSYTGSVLYTITAGV